MRISNFLAAALLVSVITSPRAQGETPQTGPTYIVNTTDDHDDGVCGVSDCTLREAISTANGLPASAHTIQFAANVTGTVTLTAGELAIFSQLSIEGPGADRLTVDANGASRVLNCSSTTISISRLTLANGATTSDTTAVGGCIKNITTLSLNACVLRDSSAMGTSTRASAGAASGGAIYNTGAISLSNCTLSGNSAIGGSAPSLSAGVDGGQALGGAIYNVGTMSLTNCTLTGNTATGGDGSTGRAPANGGLGGGGAIATLVSLPIVASIISGNNAVGGQGGGGTAVNGTTGGGGILVVLASTSVKLSSRNNIIAGNTASLGPDVDGPVNSQGFNLVGKKDGSPGFAASTDLTGTNASPLDPKLGGLQNNGGPTPTLALLAGSPAINQGAPDAPARDQRGYTRNGTPDIGAFELGGAIPVSLGNISTRGQVSIGDEVMIGGFIVAGPGNKPVLLRAIGPSLSNPPFNLANTLQDPTLSLFNSSGGMIISNDNWADASNAQSIDPSLRPSNSAESAILISLAPGAYTAIVRGANGGTGIGLVEVFDLDATVPSKLSNISTRGLVETGDGVMIGGFIVKGPDSDKVVVRAIGPSLASPPFNLTNVLQNPTLSLFDANGMMFASNDDWRSTQEADIIAAGLQPTNDAESAIVTTLTPGSYTAIVRGAGGSTGIALVEVYGLN